MKGIILTASNMSGKSSFLRMLGINILLAQTFYFVLAREYVSPFFNIVTSMTPNDNVIDGKSFYMAEAELLLRILNALEKEIPVFCPIDEIFIGINPLERISSSCEISSYINKKSCISIVTTHYKELVNILKNNYAFYYFSENINKNESLTFDYKIQQGVSQTRNAIKLLDFLEYPKNIIDNSYNNVNRLERFI